MPHEPDTHPEPCWITTKIGDLVWRITPSCREVARFTSEGRDHALPFGMRLRLKLHRRFCAWCARYARQLDLLHEAAHRRDEQHTSTLPADAKARLKSAIRE